MKVYSISQNKIDKLLEEGDRSNANINFSPEMYSRYIFDDISKKHALSIMPTEVAQAYKDGYIHIHDLEYYTTRPNCCNYDLRFFAKNGLKIDGCGDMGAVASAAKSLEVLLNHLLQALMAGAVTFSGGQGFVNFNTLLAPYGKGRSYEDIKQAIQGFIFNCNMSLVCRGGQILFSSIGVDLSCPPALADEPAIGPGGVSIGTYKDYQEEADTIFRAICEVLDEKDASGAYFRFPNTLFNIREGDLDEYSGNCKILHELSSHNPTIYFNNCCTLERSTMGCRTSLPMNYFEDYEDDSMNTGNFAYTSINLPLIAEDTKYDGVDAFYDKLEKVCEVARRGLLHRRALIDKVINEKQMSTFLLWEDKDTGVPLYELDRTTTSLGFVGLNEAVEILPELNPEKVVSFLADKVAEYKKCDDLRWSLIASPAESAAGRFAKINLKKYPNTAVQGPSSKPYLTNSSHIPVNSGVNIVEHIKNADKYHQYTLGGNILHLWLGESYPDPQSLWRLNQKITKTNTIFWAYSSVFTFCKDCGYTINNGEFDKCPICESTDLRRYDRITGYYLPIDTWNDSKLSEFKDRNRHRIIIAEEK